MTVSSSVRRAGPFLGNGSNNTFPFEFQIFDKTDVLVTHTDSTGVETELVLDSDYSVSVNPDQGEAPGGEVTYPITGALLPEGDKLTLSGALSYDQTADITNQGGFYPEVVENALDRNTIQIQQLLEKSDRAVVVPISDERTPADYWQDLFVAADAAAVSATASAAAAAGSEQAAASSEQAAAVSESNAASSAGAASASEDNAAASEGAAAASAASASASKDAAALSESNAAGSETAAAQSAVNAENSAASILDAEANSAASAAEALVYKNAAGASASNAANSEANAAASAASINPDNLVHKSGAVMTGDLTVPSVNGGPLAGLRNKIINGDMRINQRATGAQVPLKNGVYLVDRWVFESTDGATGFYNAVQSSSSDFPGFPNHLSFTTATANTPSTGTARQLIQKIEGFNIADLQWGTAGAKPITLSFKVRSTLTGTFSGSIRNGSGTARSFPFTYEITAANTTTDISVTIPGDTFGTWSTDSATGINLTCNMGTGATYLAAAGAWVDGNFVGAPGTVNVCATLGASFKITGVQIEAGETPTPFEHRPIAIEEQMCMRYYEKQRILTQVTLANSNTTWLVGKRATPTLTVAADSGTGIGVAVLNTNGWRQSAAHSGVVGAYVFADAEL